MPNFSYQICILSDQTLPNILPALDPAMKPKVLIVAQSPAMKSKNLLPRYKKILTPQGIEIATWDLPEDSFDTLALLESFEALFAKYGEDTCLNATGGTKLMSLAAYQMAQDANIPSFYVDHRRDRILWIDKETDDIDLCDRVKLKNFFTANGYDLENEQYRLNVSSESRQLTQWLVDNCEEYQWAIGELNRSCAEANKNRSLQIRLDKSASPELEKVLDKFFEYRMIDTLDGVHWTFANQKQRDYANGLWLEEYVYLKMTTHKSKLQDYGNSLEVRHEDGKTHRNEIDAAFLFDNNLYIIECKTLRFSEGKDVDILHKIDSLKDELGGLRAKGIVCSYRPLPAKALERAKNLGIEVFSGRGLKRFEEYLTNLKRG